MTTADVNTGEVGGRNMEELKRLVLSALDKNGVLADLRSTVKLHVTRAINEDPSVAIVPQPASARVSLLMSTERGKLMTELIVDFLRHYELKDTLCMLLSEAGLSKLRPSETEIANQCGFNYAPNIDLAVIEQLLSRQGPPAASPYAADDSPPTYHLPAVSPPGAFVASSDDAMLPESPPSRLEGDSLLLPVNTSLENDMEQMRRISAEIDRISKDDSPRYQDDFDEQFSPRQPDDVSPLPQGPLKPAHRMDFLSDDNVLFESRESFKDLGETPAYMHPIDQHDHVESLDNQPGLLSGMTDTKFI